MNNIKKSIICKNVNNYHINGSIVKKHQPKAGDVAIFEVLELGTLSAIQDEDGRNCHIFPGDKIMATFGNRYASNQFEGYVPVGHHEVYDLMGKGGVAGIVKSMHCRLELRGATKIRLVGFATNSQGKVINSIYHHTEPAKFNPEKPRCHKTILSIGSSMDSGKTTSAAYLCRGLKAAGYKVAFMKLTGTVFNKDRMLAFDCGADVAVDFSELGFPSTYLCSLDCILDVYQTLSADVAQVEPDYVVIEIADGILQRETEMLIDNEAFMSTIDHVLFSCGDSLSALQGVATLRGKGIEPFAMSGMINTRPLLVDEVNCKLKLPLLNLEHLASPNIVHSLIRTSVSPAMKSSLGADRLVLDVA